MSDTRHGRDDDGYFAALDFGDEPGQDVGAALHSGDEAHYDDGAALEFGDEVGTDTPEQSAIDVLDTDEPAELADTGTTHAIEILSEDTDHTDASSDPDEEIASQLVTVTNPAETVTVSAKTGGEIHRVQLSPEAVSMTASDLANEILAIAHVAQERGKAIMHTVLLGAFNAIGAVDNESLSEFLEEGMGLTSPEQAAEEQAKVFADRYNE